MVRVLVNVMSFEANIKELNTKLSLEVSKGTRYNTIVTAAGQSLNIEVMKDSVFIEGYNINWPLLDKGCVNITTLTDQVLSSEKLRSFARRNIIIWAVTYFFRSSHLVLDPLSEYKIS
jgi:hypothetical protein